MKRSIITAFFAFGFFVSVFFLSLVTPGWCHFLVYGGIVVSSVMTIHYWRLERRVDPKASRIGMWIILVVFVLFILLCLVLPALG